MDESNIASIAGLANAAAEQSTLGLPFKVSSNCCNINKYLRFKVWQAALTQRAQASCGWQ